MNKPSRTPAINEVQVPHCLTAQYQLMVAKIQ